VKVKLVIKKKKKKQTKKKEITCEARAKAVVVMMNVDRLALELWVMFGNKNNEVEAKILWTSQRHVLCLYNTQ
jgi:hypothetical protein